MSSNKKINPLTRMLDDPNKEINKTYGPVGMLSRLFRIMLKDLNINGHRFQLLMIKYLNDPQNKIPDNKKDQTSNRGNLNKEFQRPQMTWKVFCKGMRFLQIRSFRLVIEATHANGKVTAHGVTVTLDVRDAEIDEDDDNAPIPEDLPEVPYLDHQPGRD